MREGVCRLVAEIAPACTIRTASDGPSLHAALRSNTTLSAVLIGANLVADEEEAVISHIRKLAPHSAIGIMGAELGRENIRSAVVHGADAVILLTDRRDEVSSALKLFIAGESTLPENVQVVFDRRPTIVGAPSYESLTRRERDVIGRIGMGMSVALIADSLRLSPHTVRVHVTNIMKKLDLRDRSALMHYAVTRQNAADPGILRAARRV